jgi:hypothetical protein
MIDAHVVQLITDYLDQCITKGSQATLVGVQWYVDGRNKTLPLLEEINEALRHRPSLLVERLNGAVVFSLSGTEKVITAEDLRLADKQYRKEFSVAYKKLQGNA